MHAQVSGSLLLKLLLPSTPLLSIAAAEAVEQQSPRQPLVTAVVAESSGLPG